MCKKTTSQCCHYLNFSWLHSYRRLFNSLSFQYKLRKTKTAQIKANYQKRINGREKQRCQKKEGVRVNRRHGIFSPRSLQWDSRRVPTPIDHILGSTLTFFESMPERRKKRARQWLTSMMYNHCGRPAAPARPVLQYETQPLLSKDKRRSLALKLGGGLLYDRCRISFLPADSEALGRWGASCSPHDGPVP